jgi:general secretion pathway protein F
MSTYEYRGYHESGRLARGLMEGGSAKDVKERLAAQGVFVERLSPASSGARFPRELRSTVYHELAALLGAGLTLEKALDILIQSPDMGTIRVLLASVKDRIREGQSLAAALRECSASVSRFEQAILEAAERSALMEGMLRRLADFLDEQERLSKKVQSALFYPAIVMTAGICVSVLMLGFLIPKTQAMMASGGIPLPALTRLMIAAGSLFWKVLLVMGGLLGWLTWHVWRRANRDPVFAAAVDRWRFRIPVLGRGHHLLVNWRFSRTMAILLEGGVGVVDAFVLAGRATGSRWVAELAAAESERIRHGSSMSEAVRRIAPLSEGLSGWVVIGENSGELSSMLDISSRRSQEQWERYVARSLQVLEPLLMLLIGGFVLAVTLSILLPVISLTQSVGM